MAKKPGPLVIREEHVERYDLEPHGFAAKCRACGKTIRAPDKAMLLDKVGAHVEKCDCDPVEDIDVARHYEFIELDDDEEVEAEDEDEDDEIEVEDEVDEEEEVVEKKKKSPASVEDVDDEDDDDDVEDKDVKANGNGDIDGGELD
jgi:hypothetical protein